MKFSPGASLESAQAEKEGDEEAEEGSVLRSKLDDLAAQIARYAFIAAGIAVLVNLMVFWIETYGVEKRAFRSSDINIMLGAVVNGIAIVVVAVPEGLPLAVTMALSLSVKKMQLDNNLVKHLDATEPSARMPAVIARQQCQSAVQR